MRGRALAVFLMVCAGMIGSPWPATALDAQDQVLPSRVVDMGGIQAAMPDVVLWEQRARELERWVDDYRRWKQWNAHWRNTREPGWLGTRDRQTRPDPPPWLADECRDSVVQEDGILAEACRLLTEWSEGEAIARLRQEIAAARTQKEAVHKTMWWEHVHFDALWPMMQLHGNVFGVIGMHATIEVAGRFQVFVAPGAILLNVPKDQFSREWRPATDWGIAYRVSDFTMPGTGRRASLHLNLARAWLMGGPGNLAKASIDLAGFSVTMSKRR